MLKQSITLIFLSSFTQLCFAQAPETIVDPVEASAFILKRRKECILLPDSLKGKAVEGFAIVKVSVSKSSKHSFECILKLKISDTGVFDLVYNAVDSNTGNKLSTVAITPYYQLIKKYVENDIYFVPNKYYLSNTMTYMTIIVRFK